jgi:hypothetical protein
VARRAHACIEVRALASTLSATTQTEIRCRAVVSLYLRLRQRGDAAGRTDACLIAHSPLTRLRRETALARHAQEPRTELAAEGEWQPAVSFRRAG